MTKAAKKTEHLTQTQGTMVLKLQLNYEERKGIKSGIRSVEKKFQGCTIDHIHDEVGEAMAGVLRTSLTLGNLLALEDFKHNPKLQAILIEGLPVLKNVNEIDTPYKRPLKSTEEKLLFSDCKLLGLCAITGYSAVACPSENEGKLSRNVMVAKGKETSSSSHSKDEFSLHMDQVSANLDETAKKVSQVPSVLVFDSLRNSENVPTELYHTSHVLNSASYGTWKYLQHRAFTIGPPRSNDTSVYAPVLTPAPLLSFDEHGQCILRFDPNCVSTCDKHPRYLIAMMDLMNAIETATPYASINLQPGQLLMFKNRTNLHSRKGFSPVKPRIHSRWLRRLYAV